MNRNNIITFRMFVFFLLAFHGFFEKKKKGGNKLRDLLPQLLVLYLVLKRICIFVHILLSKFLELNFLAVRVDLLSGLIVHNMLFEETREKI